jgi:hypothetical protein
MLSPWCGYSVYKAWRVRQLKHLTIVMAKLPIDDISVQKDHVD